MIRIGIFGMRLLVQRFANASKVYGHSNRSLATSLSKSRFCRSFIVTSAPEIPSGPKKRKSCWSWRDSRSCPGMKAPSLLRGCDGQHVLRQGDFIKSRIPSASAVKNSVDLAGECIADPSACSGSVSSGPRQGCQQGTSALCLKPKSTCNEADRQ